MAMRLAAENYRDCGSRVLLAFKPDCSASVVRQLCFLPAEPEIGAKLHRTGAAALAILQPIALRRAMLEMRLTMTLTNRRT